VTSEEFRAAMKNIVAAREERERKEALTASGVGWLAWTMAGTIAPEYDIAFAAEPDPLEAECQRLRAICRAQAALISKLTAEVEACESRNDLMSVSLAKARAEVDALKAPKGGLSVTALRFGVP
jgi:hypothetical protein